MVLDGHGGVISLFLNSNRDIDLNIQSTAQFRGYPIGTTGYDILRDKKIIINVIK